MKRRVRVIKGIALIGTIARRHGRTSSDERHERASWYILLWSHVRVVPPREPSSDAQLSPAIEKFDEVG